MRILGEFFTFLTNPIAEMGFKDVKNIGSVEDAIKITGQSCKGSKC